MILIIFYTPILFADVTMKKTISRPSLPVEKPEHPIVRPPQVPVGVNPGIVYQDNYYNTNVVNSCQSYIDQIDELNAYIDQIEQEISELKAKEYERLQKDLKAKHKKELQEFENRKSSIKSKNSIEIKSK
jgi:predicted RNase H-like nuclease (RuvC/YqgF family)